MDEAMASEIDGVYRYYDQMLKKQQKRLIKLDARGAPEEQRSDARQSIRKYEIVLAALESQKAATEAWAIYRPDGTLAIDTITLIVDEAWGLATKRAIRTVLAQELQAMGYTCRPISITERKP